MKKLLAILVASMLASGTAFAASHMGAKGEEGKKDGKKMEAKKDGKKMDKKMDMKDEKKK